MNVTAEEDYVTPKTIVRFFPSLDVDAAIRGVRAGAEAGAALLLPEVAPAREDARLRKQSQGSPFSLRGLPSHEAGRGADAHPREAEADHAHLHLLRLRLLSLPSPS